MKRYSLFGIGLILLVAQIGNAEGPREIASFNHDLRVAAVAFSPDGKTVATATAGGLPQPNEVRLWDVASKKARNVRITEPSVAKEAS